MIKDVLKFFSSITGNIKFNQYLFFAFLAVVGYVVIASGKTALTQQNSEIVQKKGQVSDKIKLASELVNGQKVWEEYFENLLTQERKERSKMQEAFIQQLREFKEDLTKTYKRELDAIEKSREISENELKSLLNSNSSDKDNLESLSQTQEVNDFILRKIPHTDEQPKDIGRYIPAGSYVKGRLLSGISVSTGINSQSDPIPLVMRLVDDANLPQGFKSKLKDCRVIASCHGDISSERAIIRLENLICIDKKTERAIETKVAGFVVGMDGKNGVRGQVISVDNKYLKNAALGGLLSGLGKSLKMDGTFAYNPTVGIVKNKEKSFDKFKDSSLDGIGSATEKLANYYIKKAESISPVIEIPAGGLADIVFTEGVYFGQQNTKHQIEINRK